MDDLYTPSADIESARPNPMDDIQIKMEEVEEEQQVAQNEQIHKFANAQAQFDANKKSVNDAITKITNRLLSLESQVNSNEADSNDAYSESDGNPGDTDTNEDLPLEFMPDALFSGAPKSIQIHPSKNGLIDVYGIDTAPSGAFMFAKGDIANREVGYTMMSTFSGYSGYSGYSGRSGYSGYSGRRGYSGYRGVTGVGIPGLRGPTGPSGYSGYGAKYSRHDDFPDTVASKKHQYLTSDGGTTVSVDGKLGVLKGPFVAWECQEPFRVTAENYFSVGIDDGASLPADTVKLPLKGGGSFECHLRGGILTKT